MHKIKLVVILSAVLVLTAALILKSYCQENNNILSVGKRARTAARVDIQPVLPVSLNYLSRDEILARRESVVRKYPLLMSSSYTPFHPVFGAIEDGKPWWGLAGAAVYDAGEHSLDGLAEESRFIMNPFMLVGANSGSTGIWKRAAITSKESLDPTFPFFWLPESICIDPSKSFGKVTYNVSLYQRQILSSGKLKAPGRVKRFSLVAYNARDLGYNYIYFNQDRSVNVLNDNRSCEPVFIRQMLHCGNTCGCRSTCCNNMSPFMPEIDRLRLSGLPARAVVYLWKDEPRDPSKDPDMVFFLEFQ